MKISQHEFDLMRRWIEQQCGISIGDQKKYLVETRFARLVVESGSSSFGEFYSKVVGSRDVGLRDRVIDAITTNETLWFRDGSPWVAFRDVVFPQLAETARREPTRRLRIWSAACSTGQEPYTIAMIIDNAWERRGPTAVPPERFEIVATDISPSAIFIAMAGRYDPISMNRGFVGEWAPFRDKYFEKLGSVSVLSPRIKQRVRFQRFNLQDSFATLGRFDIVLLRNVAIYFSDAFKREVYGKIANALTPGGHLFVGSAESVNGYSDRFVSHGAPDAVTRAITYRLR